MNITRVALDEEDAGRLIAALDRELEGLYPEEGAIHSRLAPQEVAPGQGAFLLARVDSVAVGCGALRMLGDGRAEVKRMYTIPAARGRGVARAVLAELERIGRELGARELVLETGERQPEALALYRKAGFREITAWGEYIDSRLSLCLAKVL